MVAHKRRSRRVGGDDIIKQSKKSKQGANVGKGKERAGIGACNESKSHSNELESNDAQTREAWLLDTIEKISRWVDDDVTDKQCEKSMQDANVGKGKEIATSGTCYDSESNSAESEPKDTLAARVSSGPTHLDRLAKQRFHGNKQDVNVKGHGNPKGEATNVGMSKGVTSGASYECESVSNEFKDKYIQTTRVARGPTHLNRLERQRVLGNKTDVNFNGHGNPIGKAGAEMQSYIGVLARQKVKITYKTWKQVPQDVKDLIWESVNLTYNVPQAWKNGCLVSANAKWRQWKTYMTNNFILKHKNSPKKLKKPPDGFGISQADWKSFVISRMSEDFLKLRALQKERRKKNIYPHRLSRKGYSGLAESIKHELGPEEIVDRALLWKRARMDKNGEFEGDDLIKTVQKIDDYIKLKEDGVLKFDSPTEDVLTMALETPEHAGRVRGVGGHINPTMYFNYTSGSRHVDHGLMSEQQKELKVVKKRIYEQDARLEKLEALMYGRDIDNDEKGSFIRVQCSKDKDQFRTGKNFSDDEEFLNEVQLIDKAESRKDKVVALTLESGNTIAAYGTIVATNGDKLDGAPLPKNCMRVSIDEALDRRAPLPFPIPCECDTIGDAIGTYVAWPTHLIVMPNKKTTGKKSFDQAKKPSLSTSLPRSLKMLYCYSKHALDNGQSISISLDDDVFGSDKRCVHVHIEDIIPFCELEPISCNCIVVYIWVLYQKIKEANTVERFRFVHPSAISHHPSTRTDKYFLAEILKERACVLADRLIGTSTSQLVLVPCNIGFHWTLTIIDPYKDVVYSLDPLGRCTQDGDWKKVVNMALKLFDMNMGRKGKRQPAWKILQSPRQPDEKQCGFYVLRFMREIAEGVETINEASIQSLFAKDEYSQKEIDEVRSEWAECVQDYIVE